jgi:hypothetical protein
MWLRLLQKLLLPSLKLTVGAPIEGRSLRVSGLVVEACDVAVLIRAIDNRVISLCRLAKVRNKRNSNRHLPVRFYWLLRGLEEDGLLYKVGTSDDILEFFFFCVLPFFRRKPYFATLLTHHKLIIQSEMLMNIFRRRFLLVK